MDWNQYTPYKEWTIECGGEIEGDLSVLNQLFKLGKPRHAIKFTGEVGPDYHFLKKCGATFSRVKIKGKQYARPFYLNMYSMEREVEILDTKEYKTGEDYTFEATFQGIGSPLSDDQWKKLDY